MVYLDTDLMRFLDAQNKLYLTAFSEIKKGKKQTHWMWFIFPQIKGLGTSSVANYYAIHDLKEATDFLQHPVLAKHLVEISKLLLTFKRKPIESLLGDLDARKLRSSMSLFSHVENADPVFRDVLNTFFAGEEDIHTLSLLNTSSVKLAVA